MKLLRVRISLRWMMILIAGVALSAAGGRRLIEGDGGVTVELVNGLGQPLKDIRIVCKGESIVTSELAPGNLIRGRLWPADIRPNGNLDGHFSISFNVDGKLCGAGVSHTFDLLGTEDPNVRWNVVNAQEPEAFFITSTDDPPISPLKRLLRRLWFRSVDALARYDLTR
jgi:hypothetical protein